MTEEPESLILELLRQMRAELGDVRSDVSRASRRLGAEVESDMHSLRADVASDLLSTRKELSEQIVGLRRAVIEYHTSVIGHGVLSATSKRACAGSSSISTFPRSSGLSRRASRRRVVRRALASAPAASRPF